MSEVQIRGWFDEESKTLWEFKPKSVVPDAAPLVMKSEYDAAQSELSALREELAEMTDNFNIAVRQKLELSKRLAAAEQRNAELETECEVQRESKEQWEKVAGDWVNKAQVFSTLMQEFCDRVDRGEVRSKSTYAKFKSALKPTESGASECATMKT